MYEEQPRLNARTCCCHLIQDNIFHDQARGVFQQLTFLHGKVFGLPRKCFPFENKLQWESWQLHRRLLCEKWISLSGAMGLGHSEGFWASPGTGSRLSRSADGEPLCLVSRGLLLLGRTRTSEWILFLFSVSWAREMCRRGAGGLAYTHELKVLGGF